MLLRRKPKDVEGVQWTGSNLAEVQEFCGVRYGTDESFPMAVFSAIGTYLPGYLYPGSTGELWVESIHARMPVTTGEWIIKEGLSCEIVTEEEFAENYELVGE